MSDGGLLQVVFSILGLLLLVLGILGHNRRLIEWNLRRNAAYSRTIIKITQDTLSKQRLMAKFILVMDIGFIVVGLFVLPRV